MNTTDKSHPNTEDAMGAFFALLLPATERPTWRDGQPDNFVVFRFDEESAYSEMLNRIWRGSDGPNLVRTTPKQALQAITGDAVVLPDGRCLPTADYLIRADDQRMEQKMGYPPLDILPEPAARLIYLHPVPWDRTRAWRDIFAS